jgi:membrane-bound serine protease (ClpP class)
MKNAPRIISVLLLGLMTVVCSLPAASQESTDAAADQPTAKAAVIICKGMIDDGLRESVQRRTKMALNAGADYVIYEIDTLGGFVQSAVDISDDLVLEFGKKVHTVAYVTSKAISAGAMISVSCRDIIMRENTTIGDCAPIALGGKLEGVEREKAESFIRGIFERAAEANGYPKAVLRAMVTMQIDVYKVENLESSEYEYFEGDQLPTDPNTYDLANKELVVSDDKILTLTASQAERYDVARAVVEHRAGALRFLAERDEVTFRGEPRVLETLWSEEMVRWLNSPAVASVLVMLALLGVYIEFSTPGLGLPGLVAAICLALLIGSKYLIGLANWLEVAIFVVGVLLLIVEVFVLPGFGIAGTLGILCVLAGVFGMLVKNPPDSIPWPRTAFDWQLLLRSVVAMLLGFAGFIVLAWVFARYLPRMQFLSGLILVPSGPGKGGQMQVSMTSPPESQGLGVQVGDVGEVTTRLRPTGKARFGDAIVDVVATAEFLGVGTKVEISEIHGNRVVVKKVHEESEDQ